MKEACFSAGPLFEVKFSGAVQDKVTVWGCTKGSSIKSNRPGVAIKTI